MRCPEELASSFSPASRANRCDRLHCPRRDFSSMVIDFPPYKPSTAARRVLTRPVLRIAPPVADGATGSVAVHNEQVGVRPLIEKGRKFYLLLPIRAALHGVALCLFALAGAIA